MLEASCIVDRWSLLFSCLAVRIRKRLHMDPWRGLISKRAQVDSATLMGRYLLLKALGKSGQTAPRRHDLLIGVSSRGFRVSNASGHSECKSPERVPPLRRRTKDRVIAEEGNSFKMPNAWNAIVIRLDVAARIGLQMAEFWKSGKTPHQWSPSSNGK
jgi:hypothetical protein